MFGESVVMRSSTVRWSCSTWRRWAWPVGLLAAVREVIRRPNADRPGHRANRLRQDHDVLRRAERIELIEEQLITTEDPVEYDIDGSSRCRSTRPSAHVAQCLRSILRQDPDIILVGEIRDLETAEIAVQASLTGHMVFSTLHTNDAPATVTRLRDMGVPPFLLTATLEAVLAQRLVRKICVECREQTAPGVELLAELDLTPDDVSTRNSIAAGLRGVQQHRLQGPHRPLRVSADQRRAPRSDQPRRLDAADPRPRLADRHGAAAGIRAGKSLRRRHHH